jgi:hemerythrin
MGGVDPTSIRAIGYGSSKPIIKNEKSKEDRKLNRRVEFQIIKPDESMDDINFIKFLKDWIVDHILTVDRKYGPFLNKKGVF